MFTSWSELVRVSNKWGLAFTVGVIAVCSVLYGGVAYFGDEYFRTGDRSALPLFTLSCLLSGLGIVVSAFVISFLLDAFVILELTKRELSWDVLRRRQYLDDRDIALVRRHRWHLVFSFLAIASLLALSVPVTDALWPKLVMVPACGHLVAAFLGFVLVQERLRGERRPEQCG